MCGVIMLALSIDGHDHRVRREIVAQYFRAASPYRKECFCCFAI
jgi:hypothetical protein